MYSTLLLPTLYFTQHFSLLQEQLAMRIAVTRLTAITYHDIETILIVYILSQWHPISIHNTITFTWCSLYLFAEQLC